LPFNPFDLTKVFSQKEFPLRRVGKMTLNENTENYFAQIEQAAFSPAHMPPGIEASPDKMLQVKSMSSAFIVKKIDDSLQGRLFSYGDTHLHRLGTNYLLIPVNNPETNEHVRVCMYQRDGAMQVGNNQGSSSNATTRFCVIKLVDFIEGSCPNYYRNQFHGPDVKDRDRHLEHATFESGMAGRHEANDDDNYSQARLFYQVNHFSAFISHIRSEISCLECA
jgi:catalase